MKRKLPEKFFEQNQRAKTRKWKFFNLNQALWGAGNREFRSEAISAAVFFEIFQTKQGFLSVIGKSYQKRSQIVLDADETAFHNALNTANESPHRFDRRNKNDLPSC